MGCLNVSTEQLNIPIYIIANGYDNLHVNAFIATPSITIKSAYIGAELKVRCNIVCGTNNNYYLNVTPNTVWLTPDMIGGEFDIYSNVVWRIDIEDVEPEEPTIILYLTNGTMVANDTLIKNEDVTRISLLKNNSLVHNMYYFNNQ